jgi:hypothetical protein
METCRTGKRDLISSAADRAASGVLNRLLLSGALFLSLFRFNNLLCRHSELALAHNPLLLATRNCRESHGAAAVSKRAGQLPQYAGALFDVASTPITSDQSILRSVLRSSATFAV